MKRPSFGAVSLAVNLVALAGVLLALALGAGAERLPKTAAFLWVSSAAAVYVESVKVILRRRAKAQSNAQVPEGMILRPPRWIALSDWLSAIGPGATFGAAATGLGFASVGLGILLTFTAIYVGISIATWRFEIQALTFERDGLRVHVHGATFLVRWSDVSGVDREGPDDHRLTYVRILHTGPVIASVQPDTPRNRRTVWVIVSDGEQPFGKLLLTPQLTGFDGAVLARGIQAAVARAAAPLN